MLAVRFRLTVLCALALCLAGCAELLPKSLAETQAAWSSYDEARGA